MTTKSSSPRDLIHEAIKNLPLDSIALRKFYEAFLFRRGVSATNEGGARDETRALSRALQRAFHCDISVAGFSAESGVPEAVEQVFLDNLVSAVGSVWEKELEWFVRDLEVPLVEGVVEALMAYAICSRNALDYYH